MEPAFSFEDRINFLGVMLKVDDRLSGKYARICVEIDLDRRLLLNIMLLLWSIWTQER